MPTYEYRCAAGHQFEQFQRMSEPPLQRCPQCGEPAERLLSSGAGLLFKGSGFYITDYRSDSYKKAAAAESGEKGGEKGGGEKSGGEKSGGEKSAGAGDKGAKSGAAGGAKSEATAKKDPGGGGAA